MPKKDTKRVFIVHGKGRHVKDLKDMLKVMGIRPVVLREQPSKGRTIIEKLEKYSEQIGYVIVVLTPDDMGNSVSYIRKYRKRYPDRGVLGALKARPRQNVIFEFGFFAGKLGRNRICYLKRGNPIIPSDIEGLVYIPFKKSVRECRRRITRELRAAGYQI